MTNDDLKNIGTLIDDKFKEFKGELSMELREGIAKGNRSLRKELKKEITGSKEELRKELSEEISASTNKIGDELKEEISTSEKRIIKGVVTFVSDHLLPIIDQKADKEELDEIRQLPTIALELRAKRKSST